MRDVVTAVNDHQGTFTVEATLISSPAGTPGTMITIVGKMSVFGGPNDTGVGPDEGLSLFEPSDVAANADIFLPAQPSGTTGLARRLNPQAKYLACRWDLDETPKSYLRTITVRVSNPSTGKSENARPADTGPDIATGRVADLSPGLAQALGLKTDDVCHVEIPPAETGVAVDVNLASIDSTIFPSDMTRKLVVMTTSNNATYWVINQIGPQEGGQSLLRHIDNKTEILLSDSTVFPVRATDQIPSDVASELNKAAPTLGPVTGGPAGNRARPDDDINAKMFASAKAFVGHSTSKIPGTDGGNLACAWAVNEVTRLALGKPISTNGSNNGLSTDGIFDVLRTHHTKLNSANDASPGTIVIAPTEGPKHGHVGVVGSTPGGINDTLVYSNSSSAARFEQNYTVGKFTSRYTAKGLKVLFFVLNRDQF
jgi:hypothetical protein